jgi:hypothetical protein
MIKMAWVTPWYRVPLDQIILNKICKQFIEVNFQDYALRAPSHLANHVMNIRLSSEAVLVVRITAIA